VQAIGWRDGNTTESQAHEVEVVDRIGTGDAFAAGAIHGMLNDDFAAGIETGAAMAALAHTIRGDLPLVDPGEVQAAVDGAGLRIRR
jgi:2-dehydro-3-deoxygluconokinase